MRERPLSGLEATFLIVGAGVGGGIMGVPYLAERIGIGGLLGVLAVAFPVTCVIHLMLAEVGFRTDRDLQVVELMQRYVFRGAVGTAILWVVFAALTIAFVSVLAAYIAGQGEIVTDLTGLEPRIAEGLVYLASAGVVLLGLKGVGVAEKVGALALVACVVVLVAGAAAVTSGPVPDRPLLAIAPIELLALYGLVMYGLWAFYSVPQVVKGLGSDHRGAVRAIVAGLAINAALMVAVAVVALAVSPRVTEVAIVGIADGLGAWAGTIGSLFILVALVTSYWAVSLALADIVRERIPMPVALAWAIATLPSLLVLWLGLGGFLDFLRLAAGATAIVVVLISIPMYVRARRDGDAEPGWQLGRLGSAPVLTIVLVATAAMALGSLVEV